MIRAARLIMAAVTAMLTMPPLAHAAPDPQRVCRKAIDGAARSYVHKALGLQQQCLQKRDAGRLSADAVCIGTGGSTAGVTDARTRRALDTAGDKLAGVVADKCAAADLFAPRPTGLGFASTCSDDNACSGPVEDAGDLATCLVCTHLRAAERLIALQRPTTTCPVAVALTVDAGSQPVVDLGWTGLGHGQTFIQNATLTFALDDCTRAGAPCGVCNVGGPIQNGSAGAGVIDARRCSNDIANRCASSAECGSGGECVFHWGAPFPLSAGGISACLVNQIDGPVSGTLNVESGAFAYDFNLRSRVFANLFATPPCPMCVGDPTPNDGVASGTCNGGTRNGLGCDGNGTSPMPSFGVTSFDCPPTSAGATSLAIPIHGSSGTESVTLSAASPNCDGSPPGKKCFCPSEGQETNPTICLEDTTTPEDGTLCAADSATRGHCTEGPTDSRCAIESFRGCLNGAECPAPGDSCVTVPRSCYLDNGVIGGSVQALGMADVPTGATAHPTLAALFCVGKSNVYLNVALGLPGLGRVQLPLTTRLIQP